MKVKYKINEWKVLVNLQALFRVSRGWLLMNDKVGHSHTFVYLLRYLCLRSD